MEHIGHGASDAAPRTHERNATPVTVIGLGAMGTALARALLDAGHPTTVWNRTARRADSLVRDGAVLAGSVDEGVTASPLVIICVVDHTVVRRLLEPLGARLAGRPVVNLTSSTPGQARETAAWAGRMRDRLPRRGDHGADAADRQARSPAGLYSGAQKVFADHRATLSILGGQADYLGSDPGLASLYDLGMLDLFFAGMTGFLHASALVGADGISAEAFLPYAQQTVAILPETLAGLARDLDAAGYPGGEDTLDMEDAALNHIGDASVARGIDPAVPDTVRALARRAIAAGHGSDGFSRVVEQFRPAA